MAAQWRRRLSARRTWFSIFHSAESPKTDGIPSLWRFPDYDNPTDNPRIDSFVCWSNMISGEASQGIRENNRRNDSTNAYKSCRTISFNKSHVIVIITTPKNQYWRYYSAFSTFFTGSAAINEDSSGTETDELHFIFRAMFLNFLCIQRLASCCKCHRESFYSRLIVTAFLSEALLGSSSPRRVAPFSSMSSPFPTLRRGKPQLFHCHGWYGRPSFESV